jgi:hypothetical protein
MKNIPFSLYGRDKTLPFRMLLTWRLYPSGYSSNREYTIQDTTHFISVTDLKIYLAEHCTAHVKVFSFRILLTERLYPPRYSWQWANLSGHSSRGDSPSRMKLELTLTRRLFHSAQSWRGDFISRDITDVETLFYKFSIPEGGNPPTQTPVSTW